MASMRSFWICSLVFIVHKLTDFFACRKIFFFWASCDIFFWMREIRIVDRPKGKSNDMRDVAPDHSFEVRPLDSSEEGSSAPALAEDRPPTEKVKVRFDKFVQLVATHNFDEVLEQNAGEEIVLSSNLLMDLANAHEDKSDPSRKTQMIFIVGIVLGIAGAYLIFKFL